VRALRSSRSAHTQYVVSFSSCHNRILPDYLLMYQKSMHCENKIILRNISTIFRPHYRAAKGFAREPPGTEMRRARSHLCRFLSDIPRQGSAQVTRTMSHSSRQEADKFSDAVSPVHNMLPSCEIITSPSAMMFCLAWNQPSNRSHTGNDLHGILQRERSRH
jgi:hypothetical protein